MKLSNKKKLLAVLVIVGVALYVGSFFLPPLAAVATPILVIASKLTSDVISEERATQDACKHEALAMNVQVNLEPIVMVEMGEHLIVHPRPEEIESTQQLSRLKFLEKTPPLLI